MKNVIVSIGIALSLTLSIFAISHTTVAVPNNRTGSLAEIPSPYLKVNGVTRNYARVDMRTATTSLCAFQNGAATTTIQSVSFQIQTGTSTAATIDIATSTTAFATTTNLSAANSVAANAQGSFYWSPVGGSVNDAKLAPNEWVNIMTAGAGLGGYTYGGHCTLVTEQL